MTLDEGEIVDAMRSAYLHALCSPDPSTQNGCVVLGPGGQQVVGGFNGFPDGVKRLEERLQRPAKYHYIEHAERAALHKTLGVRLAYWDLTMVCLWATCADCARAIIASDVDTLITHSAYGERGDWSDSIEAGMAMLEEAGVEVIYTDCKVMNAWDKPLRYNGKEIRF